MSLRALVAAHLIVGPAPLVLILIPPDVRFLPLMTALSCIQIGQMMTLAFWAGMGTSRVTFRLSGTLAAIPYLSIWATLPFSLLPDSRGSVLNWVREYALMLALDCGLVLLFTVGFLLVRRFSHEIQRAAGAGESLPPARFQYSILHLLVVASVVALVLALARGAGVNRTEAPTSFQSVALTALALVIFLINTLCAPRAVLSSGPIGLPVLLVFTVAALLGATLSLALGQNKFGGWVVSGSILANMLPTVVFVASLLVVRACGFRMRSKKQMI